MLSGGNAGEYKTGVITVTGQWQSRLARVALRWWDEHKHCGKRGLAVFYWRALATAAGGAAPPTPNASNDGCGGNGAGESVISKRTQIQYADARGGLESMAWPVAAAGLQPTAHCMRGADGGGMDLFGKAVPQPLPPQAPQTPAPVAERHQTTSTQEQKQSGAGGSGWCRIAWFE